jgi:hypothetical protein
VVDKHQRQDESASSFSRPYPEPTHSGCAKSIRSRTGRGRLLNDLQDENGARWAAARCSSLLMRHSERIVSSRCWQSSLLGFPGFVPIASERSDSIEDQATFIPYMDPCHQFFARQSQNHGWVISSARTHRSKFSGLRKPSATAASLRLLPSLCAFFAICAALS